VNPARLLQGVIVDGEEFVVIDTETTGLSKCARPVEIAAITLASDLSIRHEWCSLIDPGQGPGPTWLHGIDRSMLDGAPRFEDVATTLAGLLGGRVLVGHNLDFDWSVLRRSFAVSGWTPPSWHGGICTAALGSLRFGRPMRLDVLCSALEIPPAERHRALPDACQTVKVLRALSASGPLPRRGVPCGTFSPPRQHGPPRPVGDVVRRGEGAGPVGGAAPERSAR
jgi:DNA polymerase-3 subunit epsilon